MQSSQAGGYTGPSGAYLGSRALHRAFVPKAETKKVSAVSAVSAGIAILEFARHDGCSEKLVRRGVKKCRLTSFSEGLLNPSLVGAGWRRSHERLRTPRLKHPRTLRTVRKVSEVTAGTVVLHTDDDSTQRATKMARQATLDAVVAWELR